MAKPPSLLCNLVIKADQSNMVDKNADPANRIRKPNAQIGFKTLAYTKKMLITREIPEDAINALLNSYLFIVMSMMKNAAKMKMIAKIPPVESLA